MAALAVPSRILSPSPTLAPCLGNAVPTIDDLHLAMGVFLTESSQLEDLMLNVYIYSNPDRPIGDSFNEFVDQTFGGKIVRFKQVCDAYPLNEKHRAILKEVYPRIDALLVKRNYIVHGVAFPFLLRR